MKENLRAYVALSNRYFYIQFPLTVLAAIALAVQGEPSYWTVPAAMATLDLAAKGYQIWHRKRAA